MRDDRLDDPLIPSVNMSAPPGVLDLGRHYGHGAGMSEMERKMMSMLGSNCDCDIDDQEEGEQAGQERVYNKPGASDAQHPRFSFTDLPVEIVERILTYVLLPSPDQRSQISSRQKSFVASIVTTNAVPLCCVCRLFDRLTRPKMYRTIHIAHRKIRSLLRTLDAKPDVCAMIRQCTLDSHIWTSDVDESVIGRLLSRIRSSCLSLHLGANESEMLPYLIHGDGVDDDDDERQKTILTAAALRALYVCWRDEADYDPQAIRNEEQEEAAMMDGVGMAAGSDTVVDNVAMRDAISVRQTFFSLFERETDLSLILGIRNSIFANLQHLTLDVYSHAQLDQLFLSSGYFVEHVLPLLTFLRIDLPLTTLQCSTAHVNRGALARRWPCRRYPLRGNSLQEMLTLTQTRNRSAKASEDDQQDTTLNRLAYCPSHLLRTLLGRFTLNVHRNDPILFSLLLDGSHPSCSQTWSIRATVCAHVLANSLQAHLCGDFDPAQDTIPMKLADIRNAGLETYWQRYWKEMDWIHDRSLSRLTANSITESMDKQPTHQVEGDIQARLALRWPAAQEAFLRFSAMG